MLESRLVFEAVENSIPCLDSALPRVVSLPRRFFIQQKNINRAKPTRIRTPPAMIAMSSSILKHND